MLTNRLWMSVITRIYRGLPYSIWKEEYVIDFYVDFIPTTFGGEQFKSKSEPGIVEVRVIAFSDKLQVPIGAAVVKRVANYIAEFVWRELAGAYIFARMDPDRIRVASASEEREVNYLMLRNHVSATDRILTRIVGERPPILRPWLGFIITYNRKTGQIVYVYFVVPDRAGNPPNNPLVYGFPYDEVAGLIAWEWRPGQPDDIVSLNDNYLTLDYDDPEDPSIELDLIRLESLKRLGYVSKYDIKYSGRGKHVLVWFKDRVPVYYMRRFFFHDDLVRERLDEMRFLLTGVHDTLFNFKNNRKNEW